MKKFIVPLLLVIIAGILIFSFAPAFIGNIVANIQGVGPAGPKEIVGPAVVTCSIDSTPTGSSLTTTGNATSATYSPDVNDLSHYSVSLKNDTNMGAGAISVNFTCVRSGDISKGALTTCYAKADTYKNELSTTDSNIYTIVATTASKSKVSGVNWAQTIYLADNAGATTASSTEKIPFTFAQDEASQILGVRFTLPGDTAFNTLSGTGATPSVRIFCDGSQIGYVTIDKDKLY